MRLKKLSRLIVKTCVLSICLLNDIRAQYSDLDWLKSFGSKENDNVLSIAIDDYGNIYTAGRFSDTLYFDGDTLISAGAVDAFIAKQDRFGVLKWIKRAGGGENDEAWGVSVVDSFIYITGYFSSTANFNTPSQYGTNELISIGNGDGFIAKYSNNGELTWIKRFGGIGVDNSYSIIATKDHVICAGVFNNTANFNTPSQIGVNEITSAGYEDGFIAKFYPYGEVVWIRRIGGLKTDECYSVSEYDEAIYVTGDFSSKANFNTPSAFGSNEIIPQTVDFFDAFIAKFNVNGDYVWARRGGGVVTTQGIQ